MYCCFSSQWPSISNDNAKISQVRFKTTYIRKTLKTRSYGSPWLFGWIEEFWLPTLFEIDLKRKNSVFPSWHRWKVNHRRSGPSRT